MDTARPGCGGGETRQYKDSGTRPVATGGRGGAQPPLEKFEPPPRLRCHFAFCRNYSIGIEVYPPLEFCEPPLLTIPGYGAERDPAVDG